METGPGAGGKDVSFDLNLVGHILDARYRVVSSLGEGGMASVYLAVDERMDRRVVVKVPHPKFLAEPGFRERFAVEIKSLTTLEHPNVVKALDVGTYRGLPYAVMQHLGGGNLEKKVAHRGGRIGPVVVLDWLGKVSLALDYIHRHGMVHRDVKPANILFDPEENPYLADFGIAKALGALDTAITQADMTPGSPPFMAPEAVTHKIVTPSYDQYSLAVVVYQSLSGRLPHEGADAMKILVAKASEPPFPLTQAAPRVPEGVAAVVMRALDADPEKRFLSCLDFAERYRRAVVASGLLSETSPFASSGVYVHDEAAAAIGAPPAAPPAAPASSARPPWRRWRLSVAVPGAAVLVGLLVWLVVSQGWFAGRPSEPPPASAPKYAAAADGFLRGWAEIVAGVPPDPATAFPSRIRRTRDGAEMVLVPAGAFSMGAGDGDALAESDERPRHVVTLSKAFYFDVDEVTVSRYGAFVRHETRLPAEPAGPDGSVPIYAVDQATALAYARWVDAALPTEAQWERAAKGGRDEFAYPWGPLDDPARRNGPGSADGFDGPAPVGSFPANSFGIHDLSGNVAEWCLDGYGPYPTGAAVDPVGPPSDRVVARGGAWKTLGSAADASRKLRVTFRTAVSKDLRSDAIGFRCCRSLP